MPEDKDRTERRPLISHDHQKRSVMTWLVPLIVIVLIIVFLPKVVGMIAG